MSIGSVDFNIPSADVKGNKAKEDKSIQLEKIEGIAEDKRRKIIKSILESQDHPRWKGYTSFISDGFLFSSKNYQVFQVAKLYDKIVGFVILGEGSKDHTSYLWFVVVHKEYQRKGVGKALLNNATKIIREMGVRKMILDCEEANCAFYQKFAKEHHFSYSDKSNGKYFFGKDRKRVTIDLNIDIAAQTQIDSTL